MKAKVLKLKKNPTIIAGKSVVEGNIVEVDENTLRNLTIKGVVEPADAEAKAVNLDERSTLSEEESEDRQVAAKKEAREREEAAKKK